MAWADGMKNSEGEIRDGALSLLNKDIADVSTIFNDACLVSVCAYDMESIIDAADGASILNHDNMSVAKSASIFDNTNLTAAKAASIFDNTNLTAAKAASIFDNSNMQVSKAASIIDNANLTASKLIDILDNANITSSKIKSIFETGNLSVDAKRASVLEGDQYTAADAATSVNGAFYTDDQLALAFDDSNLTVAKAASIFDDSNLTLARAKAIFVNANLAISKINSIIIDANITDDRAQQILSEIAKSDRDLTSADSIYEILDDWNDNKLTNRDGAGTTSTGFVNLFAQKDKFRPEWATISGSPTVTSGKLKLDAAKEEVSTASTYAIGTWEWSFAKVSGSSYSFLAGISQGTSGIDKYLISSNCYCIAISNSGDAYIFRKGDSGSHTDLINVTWSNDTNPHTFKVTRDDSSNFEIFEDGVSKGTSIDSTHTTFNYIMMAQGDNSDGDWDIDNMKVY